ncbi:hypothetical protein [Pseudoalteromonas tetraodonis]|uniref:hypothetical protein n=1 Tax=Pseudoalteromonas tetraodonis TaxID=43659 RepID=UPI003A97EBCF
MNNYFGSFKITIENKETGTIKKLPEQKNLILNSLFSNIKYMNPDRLYIAFGTGSTPPEVTDELLESPIPNPDSTYTNRTMLLASTKRNKNSLTNNIFTAIDKFTGTASKGYIQGNISEIGLSYDEYKSTKLMTRALIKDENGEPTVLTLTENDILTIEYTIGCSIDLIDPFIGSLVVDIGGVATTCNYYYYGYGEEAPSSDNFSPWYYSGSRYSTYALMEGTMGLGYRCVPFTGSINDFANPSSNQVTELDELDSVGGSPAEADGTKFTLEKSYKSQYGNSTGVWNGLIFKSQSRSVHVMIFDTPIEKTESTIVEMSFKFSSGRA